MNRWGILFAVVLAACVGVVRAQSVSNSSPAGWTTNGDWTPSVAPQYATVTSATLSTGHTSNLSSTLQINSGHTITIDGSLISSGDVYIYSGGTLIVNGSFVTSGNFNNSGGTLQVNAGGTITASGNVEISSSTTTVIDGAVSTNGNFINNDAITGTGTISVTGNLENNTGGSVFGCTLPDDGCCGAPGCTLPSTAGAWEFASAGGSSDAERSYATTIDTVNGRIYTAGMLQNADAFAGISSGDMNDGDGNGAEDGFLAQYDLDGNLQWAVNMGGPDDDAVADVAVGPTGNVYVTGYFNDDCRIYNATGGSTLLSSGSATDQVFVACFNNSGTLLWADQAGGNGVDRGHALLVQDTSLYVVGVFENGITFGASSSNAIYNAQINTFLVKYHAQTGAVQWLAEAKSNADDDPNLNFEEFQMDIAAWGDSLYVMGISGGTNMRFVDGSGALSPTILSNSSTDENFFVASWQTNGNFRWCVGLENGAVKLRGVGISADAWGVFVGGTLHDGAKFPESILLSTGDHDNPFLARLAHANGHESWVQTMPSSKNHQDVITDVVADGLGHVYISGYFKSDPFTVGDSTLTGTLGIDGFVARFLSDSTFDRVEALEGAGTDRVLSLAVDSANGIVLAGSFEQDCRFGIVTLNAVGGEDVFTGRTEWPPHPAAMPAPCGGMPTTSANAFYCAGDAVANMTATGPNGGNIRWYSDAGLTMLLGTGGTLAPLNTVGSTSYYVTETNMGCESAASTVTITINPTPTIDSEASTAITACGADDGTITITASGGTAPISYSIDNGGGFAASGTFTGLVPGSYEIYIEDANSCAASGSTINLADPATPAAPVAGTNATYCDGDALANMTATAGSGGTLTWYSDAGLTAVLGTGTTRAPSNTIGSTTYYVTETVTGCESAASTVTITINPTPTIDSEASTAITACGADDGTITITASGGTAPISYSIDNGGSFAAGGNFTGLAPGSYEIYIEDANSCAASGSTINLADPATPAAPVAGTNATYCDGDALANMTATAGSGGTLTWYSDVGLTAVLGTGTTRAPSNTIGSTTYYVTETVTGCESAASTVTITINPTPTIDSEASTAITACGADDGTITITASGGTAPISYSVDNGGSFAAGGNFTGLAPGSYEIYIEDANSCAASGSTINLADPATPAAPVAGTNATYCDGDALANMTATAGSAGTLTWYSDAGLTTVLGTGTTRAPSNTIGSTTYYVTETVTGCESAASTVTITVNATPTIDSEASTAITACGADDGTITITASGGTAPLSYSIDNGGSLAAGGNFTGLAPGSYEIYIEDANSCAASGSTINLADPATPAAPVAGTNATYCDGDALANMTATAGSGGTLTWYSDAGLTAVLGTGTTRAPSNTIGSTTYYITETVTGCESAASTVTITINPTPTIDSEVSTAITACGADDGTITISASGGTAPISYSVDNGGSFAAGGNFTGLAPGSYEIYIEDANSCAASGSTINLADPATPAAPVAGTNATYCDGDALANMTATAGSAGTLTWYSDAGLTAVLGTGTTRAPSNTIGSTTYYVTETVASCESAASTVTITVNPTPTIDSEASTAITACGADDGTVTITASGGTAPIGYSIDNGGGFAAGGNFTGLAPGSYEIYIEDANSCAASGSTINLADPATPAAPFAGTNATYCDGDALANMTATAGSGGTLTWYSDAGLTAVLGTGTTRAPSNTIGSTTYYVTETVASCESVASTVTITINPTPTIDSEASTAITACGADDGTITITASGGTAPISYSVDNGGSFAAGGNFTGLAPGSYEIYIEDANSCAASGSTINLADPATPAAPVVGTNATYCDGDALANMTATAGSGGTLTWYSDAGLTAVLGTGTTLAPSNTIGSTTYYVTETVTGCESAASTVTITINPTPTIDSEASTAITACGADDGTITITASGGTAPISYSIDNGGSFAAGGNFTGLAPGSYEIYIEDANSCAASGSTINLADPATPAAPVAGTNATYCDGDALANMTATAGSGGTLTWYSDAGLTAVLGTGTTRAPSNTIGSTTYYVTETAASCESAASTVTITINPTPTIDSEASTAITACGADDGTITIAASGGTAPISYSVDNGGGFAAGGNFTGLAPGSYEIYIEDANSCAASGSTVNLADPATPAAPVAGTNATYCDGDALANMTATAGSGGTLTWYSDAGLTTVLGTGTTRAPSNTIGSTTYYVTETVASCESAASTVTITINPAPTIDSEASTAITACGADDGTITITASGGTAPISYSVDNGGGFAAGGNFTGLAAGTYTVVIDDASGCSVSGSTFVMADPTAPATPVAGTNATYCDGDALANMTATAGSGGTLTWYSDAGLTAVLGTGTTRTPSNTIGSTTYYVTETVASCESAASTVTITINPTPAIDSEASTAITACGADDGTITIAASGGTAPISYSVDNGGSFAAGGNFTGLAPGSYEIYIEDANSCAASGSTINLADPATPAAPVVGTNATYCDGDALANMTATAGSGGTLTWYSDAGLTAVLGTGTTRAPSNTIGSTTYYVTETVTGCESAASTVTITINPTPTIDSEASTAITACGADDGTITITASGGTAPISYSVDNGGSFAAGGNFTGLASGTYTVVIDDASGCSVSGSTFVMADPATPAAPVAGTNATYCNGDALANMTATAGSGGTLTWYSDAGLTAVLGTGTTRAPSNTNGSTTYYVTETVTGCESAASTVNITINPTPTIDSEASTAITACAADDGTITITVSGGTAPISYSVDNGGSFAAGGNFTGLAAGTYTVVIDDASGCSVSGSTFVMADPASPVAPVAGTNATYCDGDALANMTATAGSGGTLTWYSDAGLTTVLGTGTTRGPSNTIGSTTYYVTETVTGCESAASTVTVTINPTPTIDSEASTAITACGADDGTITITASGGTAPISYSVDNGGSFAAGGNFTGLAAGTYTVVIDDASGCSVSGSTFVMADPATPAAPVAGTNATYCDGDALANMTATAGSGGTLTWYSDAGLTAVLATGTTRAPSNTIGSTTYYVTETAASCESAASTVTITINPAPTIDSEASTAITACGADDGTITITASGGTAPISYSVDNGGSFAAGGNFTGLVPGSYEIYIEDANSCAASGSTINLADPATPAAPVSGTNATYCNGDALANMTATAGSGGTLTWYSDAGLTAVLGTGTTRAPSNTIGSTTYYVTETVTGCESAASTVTITINPTPTIDSEASTAITACSADDGTITITASGGTAPISYSVDNGGSFAAGGNFTGLAPGSYEIYIEDANSCAASGSTINLADPATPAAPVAGTNATYCDGDALANMTATAGSGGTLTWYSDAGLTTVLGTSTTRAPSNTIGSTTYYVTETVASCESAASTVAITINPTPTIDSEASTAITACGADDGTITITASGGTAPISYSVDNGGSFAAGGNFTGLAAGTYTVVIDDASGCSVSGSTFVMADPAAPAAPAAGTNASYCDGDALANMTATAGSGGTLTWYSDAGLTAVLGTGTTRAPSNTIGSTTYYVTETVTGCESAASTVTITINPTPTIDSEASTAITACGADDGTITITASGGTAPISYSVDNGGSFAAGGNFTGLAAGTYTVVIDDASGCSVSGSTFVMADPGTPAAPAAGTNASYCDGDALANMTATAGSGGTLTWYSDAGLTAVLGTGTTRAPSNTIGSTTYYVTETVTGCESAASMVTITINPTPTIDSEASTAITACGADDGTITITASGGTAPISYSVDNGGSFAAGGNFTGLAAGTYTVVIDDASGCSVSGSTFVMADPAAPAAPAAGTNASYCDGDALASMTATAGSGGTLTWYSDTGLTNVLSIGTTQLPASVVGTKAYFVTETVGGCESVPDTVEITVNPRVDIDTAIATAISGCGASDGAIAIAALNGTAPLLYSINNGGSFSTDSSFTGLGPGSYTVVVDDANGCSATGATLNLADPATPAAPLVSNDTVYCLGAVLAPMVAAAGSGGALNWYADPGLSMLLTNNDSLVPAATIGTSAYYVTETVSGCESAAASVQIEIQPAIAGNAIGNQQILCSGTAPAMLTGSTPISGGDGTYSWQWEQSSDSITFVAAGGTNPDFQPGAAIDTLWYRRVASSGACVGTLASVSNAVRVQIDPANVAGFAGGGTSICAGDSVALTNNGYAGALQWQKSTDGLLFTDTAGAQADSVIVAPTVDTYYRVIAFGGACPADTGSAELVSVASHAASGTIAGADTVCAPDSVLLQATGSTGTLLWEQSQNGGASWMQVAAAQDSLWAGTSGSALYRAIAQSGACTPDTGAPVAVGIDSAAAAGVISAPLVVCAGDSISAVASGFAGQLSWQTSADSGATWNTSPQLSAQFDTAIASHISLRTLAINGVCPADTSAVVSVAVDAQPIAGSLAGLGGVCAGDSAVLQLSGYSGTIEWQQKVGAGAWTGLASSAADTLIAQPVQTTSYRAVVSNGVCLPDTSNELMLAVAAPASAGTLTGADTLCEGSGAELISSGASGSLQWQQTSDTLGPWTNVSMATQDTLQVTPAATTWYRLIAQNAYCPSDTSSPIQLLVDTTVSAGTISGGGIVCVGDSVSLALAGASASVVWQQSTNGGVTWLPVLGGNENSYTTSPMSNTDYRTVAATLVCTADTSNVVNISVAPPSEAGVANGDTALCFGESSLLEVVGAQGNIQWQQSLDTGATWQDVGGATFSTLLVAPGQTTWYRAMAQLGSCAPDSTGLVEVQIIPPAVAGQITGTDTVCAGTNAVLNLTGSAGSVQWQQWDGSAFVDIAAATDTSLEIAVTQISQFRAQLFFAGCNPVFTNAFVVATDTAPTATISGPANVCAGDSVQVEIQPTGVGPWQITYNAGGANITLAAQGVLTIPAAPAQTTTWQLVQIEDANGCTGQLLDSVRVEVTPLPQAVAGLDDAVCGLEYQLNAVSATGGSWLPLPGVAFAPSADSATATATVSAPGQYAFAWVVNVNGCIDTATATIEFNQPNDSVFAGADQQVEVLDGLQLAALEPAFGQGYWFTLDGPAMIEMPDSANTAVNGLQQGENSFIWSVENGVCPLQEDTVVVVAASFMVPTGFSPNGDGVNDFFRIPGLAAVAPAELLVFNRWGEQVFEDTNYQNTWDGTDLSGFTLPDDTYYYILRTTESTLNGYFVIKRQ